jgi:hypothetical protein
MRTSTEFFSVPENNVLKQNAPEFPPGRFYF